MATAEGSGRAKRSFEAVAGDQEKYPEFTPGSVIGSIAGRMAANRIEELLGFWLLWHTSGGFEGLEKRFGMKRTSIYRRIGLFREVFGKHPDDFVLDGITIDLDRYWNGAASKEGPP
jgi:hypothetical protein